MCADCSSATVGVSLRERHWPGLADHRTVAASTCAATPLGPRSYTTQWDATPRSALAGTSKTTTVTRSTLPSLRTTCTSPYGLHGHQQGPAEVS
jgi:hypothetical protein